MKEYAKGFYLSPAWRKIRDEVVKEAGGLCQECERNGMYNAGEEVHHIIPITPDNIHDERITLNKSNLIFLCHDCHMRRHSKKKRRFKVERDGSVIPLGD